MTRKRIILIRHGQAQHNVDHDYNVPDAPLTLIGREQAAQFSTLPFGRKLTCELKSSPSTSLIVSSPLKRALQTCLVALSDPIQHGGVSVELLGELQECSDHPCDTGSPKGHLLQQCPEFHIVQNQIEKLDEDWFKKEGRQRVGSKGWSERRSWVLEWLKKRQETLIVVVGHGDFLRWLSTGQNNHAVADKYFFPYTSYDCG